jgi:hypothetical protein
MAVEVRRPAQLFEYVEYRVLSSVVYFEYARA